MPTRSCPAKPAKINKVGDARCARGVIRLSDLARRAVHAAAARRPSGGAGESFSVSGKSRFQLQIAAPADYCCSYG